MFQHSVVSTSANRADRDALFSQQLCTNVHGFCCALVRKLLTMHEPSCGA